MPLLVLSNLKAKEVKFVSPPNPPEMSSNCNVYNPTNKQREEKVISTTPSMTILVCCQNIHLSKAHFSVFASPISANV